MRTLLIHLAFFSRAAMCWPHYDLQTVTEPWSVSAEAGNKRGMCAFMTTFQTACLLRVPIINDSTSTIYPQWFIINDSSQRFRSIISHPSSIINHQSSVINHPASIISHRSAIINHQSSIIHHQSSISHSSVINQPSSVINHQSSSVINHHPSVIINQSASTIIQSSSIPKTP